MSFGKILKSLREDKDLHQEDIAKILKVDRSTVGKWESGSSRPDYEKLVKLADFFNVSTDYLLGNTPISGEPEDHDIELIQRAHNKMDPKQRKKMMDLLKVSFDELFKEEDEEEGEV